MPIILTRYPIVYHATPKVACTSIKLALYELEYGRTFEAREDQNGQWKHIHNSWQGGTPYFSPVPAPEAYFKFAVVRDPVERFLSAYSNRVIHHGELDERHLRQLEGDLAGLKPRPSISEFIADLKRYRAASWQISHHTDPQANFIGNKLSYYDCIFSFAEIDRIPEVLKGQTGAYITLPHEQTGGPKLSKTEVKRDDLNRILDIYAYDYHLLESYYRII